MAIPFNLDAGAESIESAARILVVIALGLALAFMARRMVYRIASQVLPRYVAVAASRMVFYTGLILTVIAALSAAGVDLTALAIAGGFTSLIASFALQPLLANFFSGLYIFTEKTVAPGDVISVDGLTGRVLEVSTMSTKVVTLDGQIVRIPNTRIIDDIVVNFTNSPVRRLTFKASVAYKEDALKAVRVIEAELRKIYLVLDEPGPEVFVSELGDSGVEITVRAWVPSDHWYSAAREIMWRVKDALDREGIEIPFNQVDIWVRTPITLAGASGEAGQRWAQEASRRG